MTIRNLELKGSKLLSIDLLRFIASFSVIFYHYGFYGYFARGRLHDLDFITPYGAIYAVPLFFIISGFCIHWASRHNVMDQQLDLRKYFRRRLYRIYPPYVFALLFSMAVMAMKPERDIVGIDDFFLKLTFTHVYSVKYFNSINLILWTVAVEMSFYILYPLYYRLRRLLGLYNTLCIVFAISTLSSFLLDRFGNDTLPVRWFFLNFWFMWCLGAAVADLAMTGEKTLHLGKKFFLGLFVLLAVYITERLTFRDKTFFLDQMHCLAGMVPLLLFLKYEEVFVRYRKALVLFSSLGTAGYSIYLLQEPLIACKNLFMKMTGTNGNLLIHAVGFPVVLLMCYIAYRFVERPYMEFGKKKITPNNYLSNNK